MPRPRPLFARSAALVFVGLLSVGAAQNPAQQSIEELVSLGHASAVAGDCGQAIGYYRQTVSQGATDATLLFNFAVCLEREGDTPQARAMYQRYVDVHPTAGNVDVARGKVKELARRLEPAPDAPLSGADALWRGEIGEAIHRLVNENYTDVASQFEMAVAYRVISFSHGLLTTVETTHQEGDVGWSVGSCSAALPDLDLSQLLETAASGPFPGNLWIGCSGGTDCFSCQQFSQNPDSPFLATSSLDRSQMSVGAVVDPESRGQGEQILELLRRLQSAQ